MLLFAIFSLFILSPAPVEVFFSCGSDEQRISFTDHLYAALNTDGIRTFREDEGIPVGENIGLALKRAIYESKVSVVVFSKDFVTSRQCLDELVMVMERKKSSGGYVVVPVFYHVDPAEVWEKIGKYGEAFVEQERRFKEKMERVERWKTALKEVAHLKGLILNNRYESQFVQSIVDEIENKLNRPFSSPLSFTKLLGFLPFIFLLFAYLCGQDNYLYSSFQGAKTCKKFCRKFTNNLKEFCRKFGDLVIRFVISSHNDGMQTGENIVLNLEKTSYASDVYLSFRGEDTCNSFTSHLYTALIGSEIRTLKNDSEIQRGEDIDLEVGKAISGSKISIIVFSKDYASSSWYLDELVTIMECKRTRGMIVVPVFYDVDPSEVGGQTGSYGKAFAEHEQCFRERKDKLERWRSALREVADLSGFVVQDGLELQIIQNIVKDVRNRLHLTTLNVAPYLVGIESRVRLIDSWLKDGSDDVGIATIYGMAGIGKTTIAKIVYNMNFNKFDGRSFVANIREISRKPNGLVLLQSQLILDLVKMKVNKTYSVDEGIVKIKDAICNKRILLILDDVDQLDQLRAIIGRRGWFYPGSKIIITTRQENLLGASEVNLMFEIKKLDDNESLQLFSWYAFSSVYPIHGFEKHSEDVVHYCCGLPFALKVLGAFLRGRTGDEWESALQKLKQAPHSITQILRTSYDSLQDDHDKSLFLYIACFFIGMDKDYVIRVLDSLNFHTVVGIQHLKDGCLITINEEKKLMMHPLLRDRDMGREIARQESQDSESRTIDEVISAITHKGN